MPAVRFGVHIHIEGSARRVVEQVRLAEELGYDSAWVGDSQLIMPEAYAVLGACALNTTRITLAMGVSNTGTRHPTVIASGLAALADLAPGRVATVMGVGGSSHGSLGMKKERLVDFRRNFELIARLLQGEEVPYNGRDIRLVWGTPEHTRQVRLFVHAGGPKGQRQAGEMGYGVELPVSQRDRGPRVVQEMIRLEFVGGHYGFQRDAPDGQMCDVWLFEDAVVPTGLLHGPAGVPREKQRNVAAVYEDLRPGTYDQTERLADMDLNHVEAAINYPNIFPRFCGQGFLERDDKQLAFECLKIYNDWMIDEWCGGAAEGRLIPLTLVPLWDPAMAAAEVRRCADKGSHAIAFSENPSKLGCATMYSGDWDVLWDACQETETTVSMHIGSSSSMPTTSDDA